MAQWLMHWTSVPCVLCLIPIEILCWLLQCFDTVGWVQCWVSAGKNLFPSDMRLKPVQIGLNRKDPK